MKRKTSIMGYVLVTCLMLVMTAFTSFARTGNSPPTATDMIKNEVSFFEKQSPITATLSVAAIKIIEHDVILKAGNILATGEVATADNGYEVSYAGKLFDKESNQKTIYSDHNVVLSPNPRIRLTTERTWQSEMFIYNDNTTGKSASTTSVIKLTMRCNTCY